MYGGVINKLNGRGLLKIVTTLHSKIPTSAPENFDTDGQWITCCDREDCVDSTGVFVLFVNV